MIIFTLVGVITAFFFFMVILMTIIEGRIKRKTKEKFLWNMEKVETANIRGQRDKVETRTGGLAHDRNRTYSEIKKQNVRKA
tara:strand:+ start:241 stop:486 length:246 start_codon:yes stop_codon:yes gene_type:complete